MMDSSLSGGLADSLHFGHLVSARKVGEGPRLTPRKRARAHGGQDFSLLRAGESRGRRFSRLRLRNFEASSEAQRHSTPDLQAVHTLHEDTKTKEAKEAKGRVFGVGGSV